MFTTSVCSNSAICTSRALKSGKLLATRASCAGDDDGGDGDADDDAALSRRLVAAATLALPCAPPRLPRRGRGGVADAAAASDGTK